MFFFRKRKNILFILTVCLSVMVMMLHETIPAYASQTQTDSLNVTVNVYHKHSGTKESGGGCYGRRCTETKTETVECTGTMVYYPATNSTGCDKCGAGYSGDQSGRKCWTTYEETRTYTYYEIDCGKDTSTVVGRLSLARSTTDWTKEVILTASYENVKGMKVKEKPYLWNGEASESAEFKVTENGVYTLRLNADDHADTGRAVIKADISNIDVTPPKVGSCRCEPEEFTKEGVRIKLLECTDQQPDGTQGCGLDQEAYSYDGGRTWCSNEEHLYTENGSYQVLVRDALGNTTQIPVKIEHIDKKGPTIQKTEYDHTPNIAATTYTVTAEDLQEDGTPGAGLHEKAYSYDNGKTWTAKNVFPVQKSGRIDLAVRDRLGNITYYQETIGNIDSCGPKVRHVFVPDYWTNQSVCVCFFAEDLQEDGSEGVGIASECFSYDDGKTWTKENEQVFSDNGTARVIARDRYGNQTYYQTDVNHIDKTIPDVSLTCINQGTEKKQDFVLIACASDSQSGLPECPFSWDGGVGFTAQSQMPVSANGTYTVTVKDRAGNQNTASVTVKGIRQKTGEGKKPSPQVEKKDVSTVKKTLTSKTTVKKQPALRTNPSAQRVDTVESPKKETNNGWIWILCILLFVLLIFLLLLWWYWTIAVYVFIEDGKYRFLKRSFIHRKEGRYEVFIKESLYKKCPTTKFRFCPSFLFLQLHQDAEIHFFFPNQTCVAVNVQKEMITDLL